MHEDLRAHLLANVSLAGLVGTRIDWAKRLDETALPAIVLTGVSATRDNTFKGRSGLVGYLVQIDCWGADALQAEYTARAVTLALDTLPTGFQGAFIESQRGPNVDPGRDGEADLYRSSLDVRVWAPDAAD